MRFTFTLALSTLMLLVSSAQASSLTSSQQCVAVPRSTPQVPRACRPCVPRCCVPACNRAATRTGAGSVRSQATVSYHDDDKTAREERQRARAQRSMATKLAIRSAARLERDVVREQLDRESAERREAQRLGQLPSLQAAGMHVYGQPAEEATTYGDYAAYVLSAAAALSLAALDYSHTSPELK